MDKIKKFLTDFWSVLGALLEAVVYGDTKGIYPDDHAIEQPSDFKPLADPEPTKVSKLNDWAMAIQVFEGGKPTDANMVRNNPGNCKGTSGKFLVFKTYADGFAYLKNYLLRAATDLHPAYVAKAKSLGLKSSGELNILQFIQVYTFGDSALIQTNYANHIAKRLGVFPSAKISTLL